jgi:hypothetical protein
MIKQLFMQVTKYRQTNFHLNEVSSKLLSCMLKYRTREWLCFSAQPQPMYPSQQILFSGLPNLACNSPPTKILSYTITFFLLFYKLIY